MMLLLTLLLGIFWGMFLWLAFGAVYQLAGAVAGYFYKNKPLTAIDLAQTSAIPSIRVFLPAYKEDAVIGGTVRQLMASAYPADKMEACVIADGLRPDTVARLRAMGAKVLEVQFKKSTKSKALNAALAAFAPDPCDIAVVLDADNAPAPDFLYRVACRFKSGAKAIQGRRAPKTASTPLALLDAASEDANNHILCRGARALGFSARLAGSGMAFDYALFAKTMSAIDAVGGFDKALEGTLTARGICIEYDELALVFDEKVASPEVFAQQRGRWIAAQFRYCRMFLPHAILHCVKGGHLDFLHKALQMALPPRLLAPGILALGTLAGIALESPLAVYWAIAFALNAAALALALPRWMFQKRYRHVWLHLPNTFCATLKALAHIPQATQVFIVTPKKLTID